MANLDPLEQTQENLHPVVVAHRARDPKPRGRRVGKAVLLSAAAISGAFLVWVLLAARA